MIMIIIMIIISTPNKTIVRVAVIANNIQQTFSQLLEAVLSWALEALRLGWSEASPVKVCGWKKHNEKQQIDIFQSFM